MKQLELSLNTVMIYAKTCLFYRYTAAKDFFSAVQNKKSVLVVKKKKIPSTDPVPYSPHENSIMVSLITVHYTK